MNLGVRVRRNESSDPADNWQWRTTRKKPEGEWIDSSAPDTRSPLKSATPQPEAHADDRHTSSFDLLNGLDVADADDASPDFDDLFPEHAADLVKTSAEGT